MPAPSARGPHSFDGAGFLAPALVAAKGGRRITLCLPARDEEATVGRAVRAAHLELRERHRLLDEILVVDDGSTDRTAALARRAGARVVPSGGAGKGDALYAGVAAAEGDVIVFCDADLDPFPPAFVVGLLGPLLTDDDLSFVKGHYRRPLAGVAGEGGRVTELVAKPLLRTLFPELAGFHQPLAGECAAPREVLEDVPFVRGYGVDIGLLLDVAERVGLDAMAQVDLGVRVHRNRPLAQLGPQAEAVLRTVLARAGAGDPVAEHPPLAGGGRKTA